MTDTLETATKSEITRATINQLRDLARNHAYSIVRANWSEFPDIGNEPVASLDWWDEQPIELESVEDIYEDVMAFLRESEQTSRQFSPAEFWISALNEREDSDDAWDTVEDAFGDTFTFAAKQHAQKIADKWCVTWDEVVALFVNVTYEIITEESADHGEAAQRGWITEPGEPENMSIQAFRDLVPYLEPSQDPITQPDTCWYTQHNVFDGTPDGFGGHYENRSYHPEGDDTARFMQVLYEE